MNDAGIDPDPFCYGLGGIGFGRDAFEERRIASGLSNRFRATAV
jgi:hypothetical protein